MTRPLSRGLLYVSASFTIHDHRFVKSAVDDGWTVHVLRTDGVTECDRAGIPERAIVARWLGTSEPLRTANLARFIEAFRDTATRLDPAVIHAGPVPTVGFMAVAAAVAPVLVASWGSDLLVDSRQSSEARVRATSALRGAARVLVDCWTVAKEAQILGAAEDRIVVVPWGVDLDVFRYSVPQPAPGILRLISLRSLEQLYDIPTLLSGFAEARTQVDQRLALTVVGTGSLEAELKILADRLGISDAVRWTGRIPESDVAGQLRAHDLHISTALSDGSSISLLQAMAAGRPSIVTDSPSNREWVVPEETGWLFTARDATHLAQALAHASACLGEFRAIAERARNVAENRADWSHNRRVILSLYESILL